MLRSILFICLLLAIVPASAQETCDPTAIATAYADLLAEVTTLEDLQAVQQALAAELAVCNGLYFEDDTPMVLGPIEFPAGVYRATVITDGYFVVRETVLEGTCAFQGIGLSISQGQAADGAEAVFTSEGCTAVLQVSGVTAPYALQFDPLQ